MQQRSSTTCLKVDPIFKRFFYFFVCFSLLDGFIDTLQTHKGIHISRLVRGSTIMVATAQALSWRCNQQSDTNQFSAPRALVESAHVWHTHKHTPTQTSPVGQLITHHNTDDFPHGLTLAVQSNHFTLSSRCTIVCLSMSKCSHAPGTSGYCCIHSAFSDTICHFL